MAEEHAQGRPQPLRIPRSPFESDQTALPSSISDPSTAIYDMDVGAGDYSLPPAFNIDPSQKPQEAISPDQRLSPVEYRSALAFSPALAYQPFGSGTTRNPAPMRHFSSKDHPQPYQSKHKSALTYPSAPLASSNLHRSNHHSSYHQAEPQMQMHALEAFHDNQNSSHGSPAQRAGAPTNTHLPNPGHLANETNDLLFSSYAQAKAERDRLFRKPLDHIDDDDVEEVEQHKGKYVLAIVNALRHKDFLPPPETKRTRQKNADGTKAKKTAAESIVSLNDSDRAKWLKWQEEGQKIVEDHLDQPKQKADTAFHFYSWEVVNEIIKIHRQGFFYTNQKTDEELKCSARIEEAVRVIKEYSRVRAKLLDGDKIPNFCISPEAYAKVTVAAHNNNSTRPTRKSIKEATTSQRVANKKGALAGRYGEDKKKREKKKTKESKQDKLAGKTKGDNALGTGNSVEQETSSAVSSDKRASDSSSPVDADLGEEDEDAEGEIDDDAIAELLGYNAAPTFNSNDYGHVAFGYVPGVPSPHDNDAYPDPFGKKSSSMASFRHQPQPNLRGSGTPGTFRQAAQPSPMSTSGYQTFSDTAFGSYLARLAGHVQNNINCSPHRLPNPASYPENITNYNVTGHPSVGMPNTQGPQSCAREAPTRKRRKL
ncbi:hypothetical protein MBLNU13_g09858t1 [Cladosporium sp. NU13]